MGSSGSVSDKDDFPRKEAFLTILLLVMIKIVPTNGLVHVSVSESVASVMEGNDVNLTCLFTYDQKTEVKEIEVIWKQGNIIRKDGFVMVWNKDTQKGNTTLRLKKVTLKEMDVYKCLVKIQYSFDYAQIRLKVVPWGKKNQTQYINTALGREHEQENGINMALKRNPEQENLIIGLIRDFGKAQNTSKITACLPLPQAAGEPIPWGVIPIPAPPIQQNDVTICWTEKREILKTVIKKEYSQTPEYTNDWQCQSRGGRFEPKWLGTGVRQLLWVGTDNYGWCYHLQQKEEVVKIPHQELVCQNQTQVTELWDDWKTHWGPSLLEKYSYIGKVNWCIQWSGEKNQNHSKVSSKNTSRREVREQQENWNCTQVFTCDTPERKITLVPVKMLLKAGCECRDYNHTITKPYKFERKGVSLNCRTSTIRSPGNLVWVMGHGQWTTHLPLDGPVTQITLGVPTLCPFWKKSKLESRVIRSKRDITEEDEWHGPDSGVKFGWILESLFPPVATYRNKEMLYKLLGQTERLAVATKKGFKDLNLQLQATSRMTLQNRMALDMLLLKEHGVCGYLSNRIDHCCIHIPNVTVEVEKDIAQLESVEMNTKEIEKEAEHNWIGALLKLMGLQISGWISSIIQYIILILILLLTIWGAYKCVLGTIMKEKRQTRRLMKAMSRGNGLNLPPPQQEDVKGQDNPVFQEEKF